MIYMEIISHQSVYLSRVSRIDNASLYTLVGGVTGILQF